MIELGKFGKSDSMSRYTIEMNFAKARKQALQLENAALKLERIATGSMEDVMNSISENWKGENAGNYLQKTEKVRNDIFKVSKELKNTARAVRKIAKLTHDAEMNALELALKRKV